MAMLEKLFSRNRPQKLIPENGQQRVIPEADYQRYVFYEELFHKIVATEAALHNMEDPQEIAIGVMKAACDLYEGDWSGILIADLHSQMWRPEIWYDVHTGPMTETLFHEFEMTDEYVTWVGHLMDQKPLVIPDVEVIKESSPKEYAALQIACFVAMMMLEQKRRLAAERRFLNSEGEVDDGKLRLRYNILGQHSMEIYGSVMREQDLDHPNRRGWLLLLYLVLHKKPIDIAVIARDLWSDEELSQVRNNNRQAIFRIHSEIAYNHDAKIIDTRAGAYVLADDIHLTTDADELEMLYERAKRMPDIVERLELLKKAYNLYRGRLFEAGEGELGAWAIPFSTHYNQIFVDVTRELLAILGRQKDYHCIIEYGSKAIRMEPGIQDAYYWVIHAAEKIGNRATRDLCLATAREELTEEECAKLIQMLDETRDEP